MLRFDNDYLEGAYPKVLKNIVQINYEQSSGYGNDKYTKEAIQKIKEVCNNDNVDVHFVVGGTQANLVVISSILKPYEAVISASTGHINTHEAGAVEASGHKIISLLSTDGKINTKMIDTVINSDNDLKEHMVIPRLVFLTLPTECGTNYTKSELEAIYSYCKRNSLYLYIDGARLGYGLTAKDTDLKITDIPNLCDVFYIGGTKQGLLFGEAIVIVNDNLKDNFRYNLKQKGALLAKGRLIGIQFLTIMENDMYFVLSKNAVDLAIKLREAFVLKGYKLLYDSYTNQQFVIMPKSKYEELSKEFTFLKWKEIDNDNIVVRISTSWATKEEDVTKLISKI